VITEAMIEAAAEALAEEWTNRAFAAGEDDTYTSLDLREDAQIALAAAVDRSDLPDQPDGIDETSTDLPSVFMAIDRVGDFLSSFGDGLIRVAETRDETGAPLYARDLEAMRQAALSVLSLDTTTPYRLSPLRTLVRRVNGGMWVVREVGSLDRQHHVGQILADQHVAAWSPLIRKNAS
jgi:hypothetical protein